MQGGILFSTIAILNASTVALRWWAHLDHLQTQDLWTSQETHLPILRAEIESCLSDMHSIPSHTDRIDSSDHGRHHHSYDLDE